jgi:hypothetical protein
MMKQAILFLFVIATGILLGGGLYETFVVMPLWTSNIPDSVTGYYQHNVANPQFTLNAGGRFWIFVTPLTGLLALVTLITSFGTSKLHKRWRLMGSGIVLATVIFTFAWFIPNIIKLTGEAVIRMQSDEVASLANSWERLNWFRAFLYTVAWFASLRALMIPATRGNNI